MAKLFSRKDRNKEYANQSIILPAGVGEVTFSNDGIIKVPDEKVEALIAATKDTFDFQDVDIPKTEKEIALEKALDELLAQDSNTILRRAVEELKMAPEQAATTSDHVLREKLAELISADGDQSSTEPAKVKGKPGRPKNKQ